MSTGQKPRNPRYFPKMKVRGARRHRMAPFQRAAGAFDRLTYSASAAAKHMQQFARFVKDAS